MQSANTHPIVDDAAKNMHDAVKDLTDTLEEAASESGAVTGMVESISKAMNEVGLRLLCSLIRLQ
jgi:talin